MMMTRRDWWLGVVLIVLALLVHAAVPRYTYLHVAGLMVVRTDRWFGGAEVQGMSSTNPVAHRLGN
jgi:hypothetical protein